jgi:hypothetical protein
MNRAGHENVDFFVGTEVERTPAFGRRTLFVVGVQPIQNIQDWLDDYHSYEDRSYHIEHVFFGANHSFDPKSPEEWRKWESMITYFLERGYLCTLDIPIGVVEEFNDGSLCDYRNFIPQIRVSVPYTKLWNYNTMLKIDDKDFDATNPGVWCHSLHSLMSRETFTSWDDYKGDKKL